MVEGRKQAPRCGLLGFHSRPVGELTGPGSQPGRSLCSPPLRSRCPESGIESVPSSQGCGFLCVTVRLPGGCGCRVRAPRLCNKLPACVHELCNLMQQGSCGPVSWGVGAWLVPKPQGLFDLRLWRRLRLGVVGLSTSGLVWLALPHPGPRNGTARSGGVGGGLVQKGWSQIRMPL